jgi:hypothetical protein
MKAIVGDRRKVDLGNIRQECQCDRDLVLDFPKLD